MHFTLKLPCSKVIVSTFGVVKHMVADRINKDFSIQFAGSMYPATNNCSVF